MCSDDCCDCCDNDNSGSGWLIIPYCLECFAAMGGALGGRGGVARSEKATQINDEQPITIFVISKNRQ